MSTAAETSSPTQETSPIGPFGTTYEDLDRSADPTTRFKFDKRIGHYETVLAAHTVPIPEQPIVQGMEWGGEDQGDSEHNLVGVFNYRNANYGIVSTAVDGEPFVYVSRFRGDGDERAQIIEGLSGNDTEVHLFDYSDRDANGERTALLTLRRDPDTGLGITNQSVWDITVGTVSDEQIAERDRTTRSFTPASAYRGLKRLFGRGGVRDEAKDQRRWNSMLTDKIGNWKPDSSSVAHFARWKREETQQ